jgi:hypothetical protein
MVGQCVVGLEDVGVEVMAGGTSVVVVEVLAEVDVVGSAVAVGVAVDDVAVGYRRS